jgi:hypothetical protein
LRHNNGGSKADLDPLTQGPLGWVQAQAGEIVGRRTFQNNGKIGFSRLHRGRLTADLFLDRAGSYERIGMFRPETDAAPPPVPPTLSSQAYLLK